MKTIKTAAVFIIILGLIGGGAYLYFAQRAKNRELRERAAAELFDPYFAAIKQQSFENAYRDFTDDDYRKSFSAEQLANNYRKNVEQHGDIASYEIYSFQEKDMFGERKRAEVPVRIYFADRSMTLVRYLIRTDETGKYKLDSAVRPQGEMYLAEAW